MLYRARVSSLVTNKSYSERYSPKQVLLSRLPSVAVGFRFRLSQQLYFPSASQSNLSVIDTRSRFPSVSRCPSITADFPVGHSRSPSVTVCFRQRPTTFKLHRADSSNCTANYLIVVCAHAVLGLRRSPIYKQHLGIRTQFLRLLYVGINEL